MYSRPAKTLRRILESEHAALASFAPPCSIIEPAANATPSPLIFASPHSGSLYPKSWLRRCAVSLNALRQSEDAFVDDLFSAAPSLGAPLLRANFPRSYVDVNRAASELPVHWGGGAAEQTPLTRAGLGVIPLCLSHAVSIYKETPPKDITALRIEALYQPYHTALRGLIARAKARHGLAVLIDCHSMPGFGPENSRRADFILGDRFGRSCPQSLIDHVANILTAMGYSIGRNHPYAGGHTTRHYGANDTNVHALQIEVNRDLYLNPALMSKKPAYKKLQMDISQLIDSVIERYGAQTQDLAAE